MCPGLLVCSAPLGVRPLSTLGRSGDTRVRVIGSHIQWLVRHVRDALAITCVGCVEQSCHAGLGCHGWDATAIPSVGSDMGHLHRCDAPGDTMVCELTCDLHTGAARAARDPLRYHAVGVQVVRGQVRAGMPTVGTLRRYHGQWEDYCLAYGCRTVPLGTLCDTIRWAWFGPGCQWLGRFGDSRRSRCYGFQGRDPRRISVLTVASVAPVVIAKKQAEIATARSGENATQAIITCIEAAMRLSSYADGMLIKERELETRPGLVCTKLQDLTAKPDTLDVAGILWVLASWTVTTPCAVQRLTCRYSCSSSGRIVRCACQFHAEPVHGHRTARGTRLDVSV